MFEALGLPLGGVREALGLRQDRRERSPALHLGGGKQPAHRLAPVRDGNRAVIVVEEFARVNPESAVDGGVQICNRDGFGDDGLSQFIRFANGLACLESAAGEGNAEGF